MLVIHWEPEIYADSWYVTEPDCKHLNEISEQIEAMCKGWI